MERTRGGFCLYLICFFFLSSVSGVVLAKNEAISARKAGKALLKWKNALNSHTLNSSSSGASSWNLIKGSSNGYPCNWTGIQCNKFQDVVEINLAHAVIDGTLEKFDFSAFPALTLLNLSSNMLSGSLPPEIGTLSELVYLDLSFNSIEGTIPSQIGNLTKLQKLDLSRNQLSGELPLQLFLSSSVLYELNMRSNHLSGQIPPQIGRLTHLRTLDLSANNLTGRISPALGVLTSLQTLNLSNNSLSGSIPTSLQGLVSLQNVDLSYNHLQGQVPDISIFNEESPNVLAGNVDLCSAKLAGLQPCDHVKSLSTNPSSKLKWILIIVIPLSCGLLLLLILGGAFVYITHQDSLTSN